METLISESLATMNPECAYFFLEEGLRTMLLVFDMQSTSDMVPLLEPAMMELNAEVQLFPVMTREDLQSGFGKLQSQSAGARTAADLSDEQLSAIEAGTFTSG